MQEYRCLSTIGMLGYGIPEDSLRRGLERRPDMIGADAGSTDAGPHKLGRGVHDVSRVSTVRDIRMMLRAGRDHGIPVIIGSCGGSGAQPHLEWTWDIVREIAVDDGMSLRVAVIGADIDRRRLIDAIELQRVHALPGVPPLDRATVERSVGIVAQMGTEPIVAALDGGADVVLAGRACDAAIFAAPAIRGGADRGLAWHMGEILECGAMCAEPGTANDCMLGTLAEDRFVLEPLNPARTCTPVSVACHSLYERADAQRSEGPGHILDLSECRFEALDGRQVAVHGSRYIEDRPVTVKLEGVSSAGFRALVIGGIRDPIAIQQLDETTAAVAAATDAYFGDAASGTYTLRFVVYGRDGVMGPLEPTPKVSGHEVGILLDVVARDQELANAVCAFARSQLQHYHYEGIRATGANIAFPTAPSDIPCGEIFEYTVYHLMEVDDPAEPFPIEYRQVPA